ncbi:hypothetical protein [Afifella aestuarii]|uniref:hypothetical protein n=1 Tax=Afifella aestuarii TaxID=1909496 RepID=UPI000FE3AF66|nr:hypothetical protein [Afifella aestuarii]
MGHGNWSDRDWAVYAARSVSGRSRSELFEAKRMKDAYDPAQIKVRESRDSAENPEATPIIIGVDVTGSMGILAEELVVKGLNEAFTSLIGRKPVSDPHVMAMAIGDAQCDRAPLQVTQFEADLRIVEQLRQLWLEGGGGGNGGESYCLAHIFAGLKTAHDAMERRGKRGFLFTVGDEPVHDGATREQLSRVFGAEARQGVTGREAVRLASESYEVFHIIVDGSYAANHIREVRSSWEAILPERVIHLRNPAQLAQTIVSTIEAASIRAPTHKAGLSGLLPAPLRRRPWGGWAGGQR